MFRGFVYQVDLTVTRWLELGDAQRLDLECGEDIDRVGRALADDGGHERRLLEQVKHRIKPITLRAASAVEAVSNAVCHLLDNPGLDLWFQYTTNAATGRERPAVVAGGVPAIQAWELVRLGEHGDTQQASCVAQLRSYFLSSRRPDAVPVAVWDACTQHLRRGDGNFLSLMRRFEWATGQPEAGSLAPQVRDLLTRGGHAADQAEADELYNRLFLYVFKRLTQSGVKSLTRAELVAEVGRPTLSAEDRRLLSLLGERVRFVEGRVGVLEDGLASVRVQVRALARKSQVAPVLVAGQPAPDTGPPLPPAQLCGRAATVARLREVSAGVTWVAVHGSMDAGKTQLVRLACEPDAGRCVWVRLPQGVSTDRAAATLDASLRLTSRPRSASTVDRVRAAVSRLGPGGVIVFDDLPRMASGDKLARRVAEVVHAARTGGVRVLSTSQFPMPVGLANAVGPSAVTEMPGPPLTDEEAGELLLALGAPATIAVRDVAFLNTLTSGHPMLLAVAAEYLAARGWTLDAGAFDAIVGGAHAARLTADALARLVRALDEPRRDLLYRLTLTVGRFTLPLVGRLAEVDPALHRPRELSSGLVGPWAQPDTADQYVLSPLVRAVGANDLTAATRAGCHLTLAEARLAARMTVSDAGVAVTHLVGAAEFDRAGGLFLTLLEAVEDAEAGADVEDALVMWRSTPLPDGMGLGLRLMIRGTQLRVLAPRGRPVGFVGRDAERLAGLADPADGWAVAHLSVAATIHLAPTDPDAALRLLRLGIALPHPLVGPDDGPLFVGDSSLDELLWHAVRGVNTAERLETWLATVDSLPPDRFAGVFRHSLAAQGSLVLADRLNVEQLRRPAGLRDWPAVLRGLDALGSWARCRGLDALWACSVRATLYATSEQGEPDRIVRVADAALSAADHPVAELLVAGTAGRALVKAGRHAAARPYLGRALAQPAGPYAHDRMLFLLAASHAHGVEDPEAGVRFAREAVELGRADQDVPRSEVARACGELAVAEYLAGGDAGAARAFDAWSEAVERHLDVPDKNDEWKDALVIMGSFTGYFASLTTLGRPPDRTQDGSPPGPPVRGVLLTLLPARLEFYRESTVVAVQWLMAHYARGVGKVAAAARWLERAADASSDPRFSRFLVMVRREMIPHLLLADRYADAVDAGLRGSEDLLTFQAATPEERERLLDGGNCPDLSERLTPDQRLQAERFAVVLAVLPGVLRIGTRAVDDRPEAQAAGRELAAVCRQVAVNAHNRQLWDGVANLLDLAFADAVDAAELTRVANTFMADEQAPLRAIGYLLASLYESPEQALPAQVAVMTSLSTWHRPDSLTHRLLLVPFVESFWAERLRVARFRFRTPAAVERAMADALGTPEVGRVRAVLRAVRLGILTRLPAGSDEWLAQGD